MIKKNLQPQILLLLIIFAAFALNAYPQSAATPDATPPAIEAMGENDSLPFMQNQTAAENNQPGTGNLLIKTVGAMLLIVGLMFFGAWGLKKVGFDRFKPKDAAGAIDLTVVSTVSMGSGRTISAVRFGERVLLVGSTAQTFTLLADEPAQNEPLSPASRSVADLLGEQRESFGNEFQQAQQRLGDWEDQGERFK